MSTVLKNWIEDFVSSVPTCDVFAQAHWSATSPDIATPLGEGFPMLGVGVLTPPSF